MEAHRKHSLSSAMMEGQCLIFFCAYPSPTTTSSGSTIQNPLSLTHILSNEPPKICSNVKARGSGFSCGLPLSLPVW